MGETKKKLKYAGVCLYFVRTTILLTYLILIDRVEMRSVRTYKYLGLLVDDPVAWRPAVKDTITSCQHLVSALRRLGGTSWELT